jgi:hypothetical protein
MSTRSGKKMFLGLGKIRKTQLRWLNVEYRKIFRTKVWKEMLGNTLLINFNYKI